MTTSRQELRVFFQKLRLPNQPQIETIGVGNEVQCIVKLPDVHHDRGILAGMDFEGSYCLAALSSPGISTVEHSE